LRKSPGRWRRQGGRQPGHHGLQFDGHGPGGQHAEASRDIDDEVDTDVPGRGTADRFLELRGRRAVIAYPAPPQAARIADARAGSDQHQGRRAELLDPLGHRQRAVVQVLDHHLGPEVGLG
jgi:hypothetical protein